MAKNIETAAVALRAAFVAEESASEIGVAQESFIGGIAIDRAAWLVGMNLGCGEGENEGTAKESKHGVNLRTNQDSTIGDDRVQGEPFS